MIILCPKAVALGLFDRGIESEEKTVIDVVALGEVLIDFTSKGVDAQGYPTLEAHPGGAPANFLAALGKFGAKTVLMGKVGNDAFGKLLLSTLEKAGIGTQGMVVDDNVFTTMAFVTLDEKGDRTFSFARKPGADTQLCFEELDLSLIEACKVFHFGTLSLTDEPARTATCKAVAYAKEMGKLVSFDPNLRKPLWKDLEDARMQMLWGLQQADVVKISDEEVEFLFGMDPVQGAAHILENYEAALVFVTCGADGCYFSNGKAKGHVPGLQGLQVVDTTGAGDIFGGSALWKMLGLGVAPQNLTEVQLRDIVSFACTSASLSTTLPGGISSVHPLEEVLRRM